MEVRKDGWKTWKKGGVEFVGLKNEVYEESRKRVLFSPRAAKERRSTNCVCRDAYVNERVKCKCGVRKDGE